MLWTRLAWFLCCATVPHDKLPGVQRGGLEDQHADDCNVVSRDRSSTTKVTTVITYGITEIESFFEC